MAGYSGEMQEFLLNGAASALGVAVVLGRGYKKCNPINRIEYLNYRSIQDFLNMYDVFLV